MKRFFALALAAACISIAAGAKRPMTHEDLWLMKRLGAPATSPDGRWAVFSVTEPSYDAEEQVSDLWIVATDGATPQRRLTSTASPETGLAWSPDSRQIAFSAKRGEDEVSQSYTMDMTGPGEARRITSLATGAANPAWGPAGERLLFTSNVYPGKLTNQENADEKKARKDRKYKASVYEGFPVRRWDEWRDDRKQHLFVQQAKPDAEAKNLIAGSQLASATGFDGVNAPAWSPDGSAIVFSAEVNRDESAFASVKSDLYRVPVSGGEPKRLTSDAASYGDPTFSPNGRHLYALRSVENEHVYTLTRVARFDWPDVGAPEHLTSDFDRSVSGISFAADGKSLFLTADEAGRTRIFSLKSNGGTVRGLDPESRGVYSGVSSNRQGEQVLTALWQAGNKPAEIVRINPRNGKQSPLTSLNVTQAAEIDWQPFREFWFESKKGRRIHNWLVLPPGFDETKTYPLLLFIHGGPYSSSKDSSHLRWSAQLLAAPGYVVLMTDYTGSVGYGEEFSQRIQGDPLRTPGEEVLEAADQAIERFAFIDGERQCASGASYGGHLVNWLQAVTSDGFDCFVGHAGLVSLEGQWGTSDGIYHRERGNGGVPWGDSSVWKEQSPSTYAENFTTPTLLTIGERDYRVPLNQTLWTWAILQRLKTPSKLIVFHEENHWIGKGHDAKFFWNEVHAWLAKYLGPR